jgi:multidrug efflux pump subunit AcrA (membrane-fusion protein)
LRATYGFGWPILGLSAKRTAQPEGPIRLKPTTSAAKIAASFRVSTMASMGEPQHRQLWPGTFVNVDLTTSVVPNALTIPTNALQQNDNGQFVFVVGADNRVKIEPVEVTQRLHAVALIAKGLQAGETVVVQGQYRLTPGTLVVATAPSNVLNPSTASSGMLP